MLPPQKVCTEHMTAFPSSPYPRAQHLLTRRHCSRQLSLFLVYQHKVFPKQG